MSDSARVTLITPALPHAYAVSEALIRQEISIQFLEECVRLMLRRAHRIATQGKGDILYFHFLWESSVNAIEA